MKLPRDLDGKELAALLKPFGDQITRQTGSHMRLTSRAKGKEHHLTVPAHNEIRVGTLHSILREVASYLEMTLDDLTGDLFQT